MSSQHLDDEVPDPEGWEEGWHYTSWSNWMKIRAEGLKPTRLSEDKILAVQDLTDPTWDGKAVWVWIRKLNPEEHMGSVIYQLAMRAETKIVTLKVRYQFKQRLAPLPDSGGTRIQLRHNGKIEKYRYHHRTPSCLVVTKIPPEDVELVKVFDITQLLGVDPLV